MTTYKPLAIALAFTSLVWLGSLPRLPSQKNSSDQVMHRTVKIEGLDIFYREAGPRTLPQSCYCMAFQRHRTCFAI